MIMIDHGNKDGENILGADANKNNAFRNVSAAIVGKMQFNHQQAQNTIQSPCMYKNNTFISHAGIEEQCDEPMNYVDQTAIEDVSSGVSWLVSNCTQSGWIEFE